MARHGTLDLRIPSDLQQIEPVVAAVVRRCAELSLDARQLALNLPVALTEALSNAILRGNGEDDAKEVRVRVVIEWWLEGDLLKTSRELEITPHEAGFKVWDAFSPVEGPLVAGSYRIILRSAGGQLIGRSPYLQSVFLDVENCQIGDMIKVEITATGPNSLTGCKVDA